MCWSHRRLCKISTRPPSPLCLSRCWSESPDFWSGDLAVTASDDRGSGEIAPRTPKEAHISGRWDTKAPLSGVCWCYCPKIITAQLLYLPQSGILFIVINFWTFWWRSDTTLTQSPAHRSYSFCIFSLKSAEVDSLFDTWGWDWAWGCLQNCNLQFKG